MPNKTVLKPDDRFIKRNTAAAPTLGLLAQAKQDCADATRHRTYTVIARKTAAAPKPGLLAQAKQDCTDATRTSAAFYS